MTGLPPRTRQIVYERDNWRCLGCGRDVSQMQWRSVQHRKARGVGGTNDLSNLVTLCGSATSPGCHLWAESRDDEAAARGLYVPSWNDPREIPVVTWTGKAVYLHDDGGVDDHYRP